ncbi:MAG: nitroreductase family protein [Terracidiphilus sp.]|jgi:nitroreductase
MTLSAVEVNTLKQAPAVDGVLPVVLSRWSTRTFADRDVSSADLRKAFEAARWAASSYNEQPWRFLIGKRNSSTHKKILSTLIGFNQSWAGAAPVLILGVASSKFAHNGTPNGYALYDLGAAAATFCLQAAALGLKTHSMAGFDQAAAREAFGIPEDYLIGAAIALGYQGEPSALGDEHLRELETSPRSRKELNEFVLSAWGEPANLS